MRTSNFWLISCAKRWHTKLTIVTNWIINFNQPIIVELIENEKDYNIIYICLSEKY